MNSLFQTNVKSLEVRINSLLKSNYKHQAKTCKMTDVSCCATKQHDLSSSSHLKISFFVVISVSWHCLQHSDVHWGGEVRVRKYTCQMFSLKVFSLLRFIEDTIITHSSFMVPKERPARWHEFRSSEWILRLINEDNYPQSHKRQITGRHI